MVAPSPNSQSDKWTEQLFRFQRLIYALSILIVIGTGLGVLNLQFSHDYRAFFDPENPHLLAHEAMEQSFTQSDGVNLFLYKREGDFFTIEDLSAIADMTEAAWGLPHVIRVDSLTNYQYSRAEDDDLAVSALFQEGELATSLEELRSLSRADEFLANRLISADGKTVQIIATTQLPDDRDALLPTIADAVEELKTTYGTKYPDYRIASTGVIMLSNSFFDITIEDMTLLFPLMVVLLGVLMAYFFRSVALSLLALIIMALTISSAMGIAGWMGVKLTPASGQAPIIILTIAIADSIHLIVSMRKYLNKGLDAPSALRQSLAINVQPIFLTSLTTALGFLSLNFSDTPPFRDLGTLAAIGTGFAFFFSIFLLPLLLQHVKVKADTQDHMMERLEHHLIEYVIRHKRLVFTTSIILLMTAIALTPNLRINDNFVNWISPGAEFRDDADFISKQLPGIYAIQFSLDTTADQSVTDIPYLEDLQSFTNWAKSQEEVANVTALSQIMTRLNKNIHGDDPTYNRLPDSDEAAAQYLLLYELSLPQGLDLNTLVDISRSRSRVLVMMKNISSDEMLEFKTRAARWGDDHLNHSSLSPASGTNIIFAHLTGNNLRSMFTGTLLAFGLIAGAIAIALKSFRLGILSLLPNLAPALFAFGIWAVAYQQIGLYAAFVTATSLGLIVDFTVHLFSKYARALNDKGLSPEDAIRDVFATTGMALWISAIVLLIGFLILTLSNFAIIALMAAMVALTILIGLIADFTMTPALLLSFAAKRQASRGKRL